MANIEKRIVEIELKNEQFKRETEATIESLDDLDNKIHGLADNDDLNNFGDLSIKISDQFSLMGQIVESIFRQIGDTVASTIAGVVAEVNKLTLDPVTEGFGKYEEKVNAVQTIMNATGKTIDEIDERLEKLIWFTDETSYSFTDMTATLSKFTSAGVELDDSITAMIGIANWAGTAGVNAKNATRAYYNLAQAIGAGSIKAQDWKSIEMLSMNTEQFNNTVIETAKSWRAFGAEYVDIVDKYGAGSEELEAAVKKNNHTLEEAQKYVDYYTSTVLPKGYDWETLSSGQLRGSLTSGWFTSDLFMEVMKIYGDFTEQIYKFQNENEYDTASQAIEEYNKQNKELIDSLYDAYTKFGEGSEEFREILNENGIGIQTALDFITVKKAQVFNENLLSVADNFHTVAEKFGIDSTQFADAAKEAGYTVEEAADMAENGIDKFKQVERSRGEIGLRSAQEARTFTDAWEATITAVASQWSQIWEKVFGNYEEASKMWTSFSNELWNVFAGPIYELNEIFAKVIELDSRLDVLQTISNIWAHLNDLAEPIKEAFATLFPELGDYDAIANKIKEITTGMLEWSEQLSVSGKTFYEIKAVFYGIFQTVYSISIVIGSLFKNAFRIVGALLPDFGKLLSLLSRGASGIGDMVHHAENADKAITDATDNIIIVIQKAKTIIGNAITTLTGWLGTLYDSIKETFSSFEPYFNDIINFIQPKLEFIQNAIEKTIANIGRVKDKVLELPESLTTIKSKLEEWTAPIESILELFKPLIPVIEKLWEIFTGFVQTVIDFIPNIRLGHALVGALGAAIVGSVISSERVIEEETYDLVNFFGRQTTKLTDLWDRIVQVIERTFGNAEDMTWLKAKSNYLMSIAKAVLIFSVAMLIVSSIDIDKIIVSIGTLGASMAGLIGVMFALMKITRASRLIGEDLGESFRILLAAPAQMLSGNTLSGIMTAIDKLAIALGIVVGAIVLLAKAYDNYGLDGFIAAFVGITLILAEFYAMTVLIKKMGVEDGAIYNMLAAAMGKLAIALAIMTIPIKVIGSMEWYEALQGVIAVTVVMAAMALMVKQMKSLSAEAAGIAGLFASFILLAIAINMVTLPIVILGKIKFYEAIQGILALLVVMEGYVLFLNQLEKLSSKAGWFAGLAASMILIGFAINTLMLPLIIMSKMSLGNLIKGLLGIAAIMAEMYFFTNALNQNRFAVGAILAVAASMIAMSIAFSIMMIPIKTMSRMSLPDLLKGLGGIAAVMAEIALFIFAMKNIMTPASGLFDGGSWAFELIKIGAGLIIISLAISILGKTAERLGKMDWESWIRGLGGMLLILAEIAGFTILLTKTSVLQDGAGLGLIALGAGLIAISVGLDKLADVVIKLGALDFTQFISGLLYMAGLLAFVGVAATIMNTFCVQLVSGALIMLALGAACWVLGKGLDALHTAFFNIVDDPYVRQFGDFLVENLGPALADLGDVLFSGIEEFGHKSDEFWQGYGEYLYDWLHNDFLDQWTSGVEEIKGFVSERWEAMWTGILHGWYEFWDNWDAGWAEISSGIAEGWDTFWSNIIAGWYRYWDNWDAGWAEITEPITRFGQSWYDTFEGTGKEIFRIQKEYWEPGVEMIKEFFTNIGIALEEFFSSFIDNWTTGWNDVKAGFDGFVDLWKLGWDEIATGITTKITEITDGIKDAFDKWNEFFKGAGEEFYDLNSTGWGEIEDAIQGVIDKFNGFVETWTTGWNEIKGGWSDFWGNWGTGWNEIEAFFNKGQNEADSEKEGYREAYGINSPSEETKYEEQMKLEGRIEGASDPSLRKELEKTSEENAKIIEEPYENIDVKGKLREKVYGWIDTLGLLNNDQKNWIKNKFEDFAGTIDFSKMSMGDIDDLFNMFTGGIDVSQLKIDGVDTSNIEEQMKNATSGVTDLTNNLGNLDVNLGDIDTNFDTASVSTDKLSNSLGNLNTNLEKTNDLSSNLDLSNLATKAEAEGAAIGDGIKTGITDSTRKLTYNDIIHRNAIMRAAQKDGIWSESFDKALKAAGYTDDFYSTADRLKIYNEARATRTANFSDRINIKDSAELYRLITTLNNNGVMSDEFENALRSYYGDDYKELTAKEKNDLVASLTDAYAKEEEFIANNYEAILKAYESGTGTAAFKEMFNLQGSDDRDLKDFIDRTKAYKNYQDRLQNESEKQGKVIKAMYDIAEAFNQFIDSDGVKVTMAKAKMDVLENALKVVESSAQKDGVKKNSLEYVQALDQLNWSYEDAEQYLKLKAEEDKKKAGGTTATAQQKTTTSSTSETKANTTSTYNPVTTVKADNVTVDTKTTTATAQTSTQVAGDITGYIKEGVQKLTNIDATITLMNTKIDQMAETIVVMNETALNELALLNGWKGESGAHNAAVAVRLANIQNRGVPIANRASFMQEVAESTDAYLGNKVTRRARGN